MQTDRRTANIDPDALALIFERVCGAQHFYHLPLTKYLVT